jgi:hypothetical protein
VKDAEALTGAGAEVLRGSQRPDRMRTLAEGADGVTHAAFDHDFSNLQRDSEDDRKASTLRQPENGKSRPV